MSPPKKMRRSPRIQARHEVKQQTQKEAQHETQGEQHHTTQAEGVATHLQQQPIRHNAKGVPKRKKDPSSPEAPRKRTALEPAIGEDPDLTDRKYACILHWVRIGQWPDGFGASDTSEMPRGKGHENAESSLGLEPSSPKYLEELQKKDVYPRAHNLFGAASKDPLVKDLLRPPASIPTGTAFDKERWKNTLIYLSNRKEIVVMIKIGELIMPPAFDILIEEAEATQRDCAIDPILVDTVDCKWNLCRTILGKNIPKPDHAVGFAESAFTPGQISKLQALSSEDFSAQTTMDQYLPFIACEAKQNKTSVDIGELQNLNNLGVALRAVVHLFRLAGKLELIEEQILGFSIAYNGRIVSINAHYATFSNGTAKYWRENIWCASFASPDEALRWTSYGFVQNVYLVWAPAHLKRVMKAIDAIEMPAPSNQNQLISAIPPASGSSESTSRHASSTEPGTELASC